MVHNWLSLSTTVGETQMSRSATMSLGFTDSEVSIALLIKCHNSLARAMSLILHSSLSSILSQLFGCTGCTFRWLILQLRLEIQTVKLNCCYMHGAITLNFLVACICFTFSKTRVCTPYHLRDWKAAVRHTIILRHCITGVSPISINILETVVVITGITK